MAIFILNGKGNKKGATAQRRNGVMVLIRFFAFLPFGL